jgi:tetratricopeptide (TPR) repeat protein
MEQDDVWILESIDDGGDSSERHPVGKRSGGAGSGKGPVGDRRQVLADEDLELSDEVVGELRAIGGRERAPKLAERLAAAAQAYERDRFQDALRISRPLVDEAPGSAAVRELHGLACYRLGKWRDAVRHLQASVDASEDVSQIPVIMDCCRALGRFRQVEKQWERLRQASAPSEVLVEGRLVLAASLADRGDFGAAITVLTEAGASRVLRNPAERHLRQWYLLGDLYERAGDAPKAREFFGRVVAADPELTDASERLASLGRAPRRTREAGSASARKAARESARSPGTPTLAPVVVADESRPPVHTDPGEESEIPLAVELGPAEPEVAVEPEVPVAKPKKTKVEKADKKELKAKPKKTKVEKADKKELKAKSTKKTKVGI